MTLALGILFSGFVRKMAPTLRSALYAFQGLTALGIASLLFFLAPWGLSLIDPTAGSYDFGVITRALAGAAVFFLGTFCVWLSMWLDWPDVLKWADEDKENPKGKVGAGLKDAWGKFPDKHKIWFLLALFFGLLAFFSTCVFLIPA